MKASCSPKPQPPSKPKYPSRGFNSKTVSSFELERPLEEEGPKRIIGLGWEQGEFNLEY
jgi:hypothetical protein